MYKTPNHQFHPLLADLEAAMDEVSRLHAELGRFISWLPRVQADIEDSAWTARIEAALDKPDELQLLKLRRQEAILLHESVLFAYHAVRDQIHEANKRLFNALGPLVEFNNTLTRQSTDQWLKPIIQNNVLLAEELRRKDLGDSNIVCLLDADRNPSTLKPLQEAFAELLATVKALPVVQATNLYVGHSLKSVYPCDAVVPPSKLGFNYQRDEMRYLTHVRFVDTMNTKHPHLQRLSELIPAFISALERVRESAKTLRSGEKGRVNEKQYAARLVQVLDGYPQYAIKDAQRQQHQNRLSYQSARTLLFAEILGADQIRRELVQALRDAIPEAEAIEKHMVTESCVTTDWYFTRRLALINVLAADLCLRDGGRQLTKLLEEHAADITDGRGQSAVDQEYAELAQYYGSFRKLDELTKGENS